MLLTVLKFNVTAQTEHTDFEDEVNMYLASFDITLNGQKYDSNTAEYPCLVYKDITYLPLTSEMCDYIGLKTYYCNLQNYRSKEYYTTALFIGNASIKKSELPIGKKNNNPSSVQALPFRNISNYNEALQIEEQKYLLFYTLIQSYDHNGDTNYPIMYYKDTYYLPLTWNFAYNQLGWEYFFDIDRGLFIDSRTAFRPELRESSIDIWVSGHYTIGLADLYIYGHDYYIWHDINGRIVRVYDKKLGKSQSYVLGDYLNDDNLQATFYYNDQNKLPVYANGILTLEGKVFDKYDSKGIKYDALIVIDVYNGIVTITEKK